MFSPFGGFVSVSLSFSARFAGVRSVVYQMAERYGALDADGVLAMFVRENTVLVFWAGT